MKVMWDMTPVGMADRCQTTRRHIPANININIYHRENLASRVDEPSRRLAATSFERSHCIADYTELPMVVFGIR